MWQRISRFGLQYCDLPTMLSNVTCMLRHLALNIDPRDYRPISKLGLLLLVLVVAGYYYVYLVSMAWFVFWRSRQDEDLLSAIIVFSLGLSSEIGITKLYCMFAYRKNLKNIVGQYLACDAAVDPNTRFAANINVTLRTVKRRAIIVWNVIMWNGIFYIVVPLLRPGRHLMEDVFIFYGLEPQMESPNYEIAFILNMAGVFVDCYPVANVTSFLIIVVGYTEAQMLALCEELRNLWPDSLKDLRSQNAELDPISKEKEMNKLVRKRLENILKIHTTNINLLRQIETVFRVAIAIEFLLLIMGIIAELLGGLENTWLQMPFALMIVGTDCFTGQRIMDASAVFEKAVYDSKWENFDVGNRKIILLMLQNSQKGMKLSVGSVATLSFECLMVVYRITYSAYTTLRSTMGDE